MPAGLSLVEVMVAMALLVVGSLSLLSVVSRTMSSSIDDRARVTASTWQPPTSTRPEA